MLQQERDLTVEQALAAAAAAAPPAFRDFKDTVFTFLRILLRLFEEVLVSEDLCCLFLRIGAPQQYLLSCILGNPLGSRAGREGEAAQLREGGRGRRAAGLLLDARGSSYY